MVRKYLLDKMKIESVYNKHLMKFQLNSTYLIIALIIFLVEVCIAYFLKTGFIRHTLGDYLVVMLVYCFIKGITNLSVITSALLTFCIAFSVEFLQLTPILEVANLKQYKIARIIFGTTFSVSDLVAYSAGVITILIIEYYRYGTTSK